MNALFPLFRLLLLLCCAFAVPAHAADPLEFEKAFRFSARMKDARTIEVRYEIARGYYMYRDNFRFVVEGAQLGAPAIPAGKQKYDPNFQKTMDTHRDSVAILLPVQGIKGPLLLKATSQGCADAGVCYPPTTQSVTLVAASAPASSSPLSSPSSTPSSTPRPAGGNLFNKPANAPGISTDAR